MQTAPAVDLRAHARYRVSIPIRFSSEARDFQRHAEIVDLSEQGMFVRGSLEAVGTKVAVNVSLDGGEPIGLRGVVVWVNERGPKGAGMGIQLFGTPQGYLRRLVDLVTELRASGRVRHA